MPLVRKFYQDLDGYFHKKNSAGIEEFLETSWAQARQSGHSGYLIAVANELGGWYRTKGNLEEAKHLYRLALREVEKINGQIHENYATTLINAGDVYLMDRDYPSALDHFTQAQEILSALGLEKDYRNAALLNNMSVVYRESGQFDEAIQALQSALHILENLDNTSEEVATSLINIGQLEMKQGNCKKARQTLEKAQEKYETQLGTSYPHYAIALSSLGECAYYQGAYGEAEAYYAKALEDMRGRYGDQAPVVRATEANLARVQQLKGGSS